MNDLAAWLLEQVTADEREARDALEVLSPEDAAILARRGYDSALWMTWNDAWGEADGNVGATPARVLAECDAKRRIVARFQETARPYGDARQQEIHETIEDEVLPFLAAPYADRPGYRDEWRTVVVAS